MLKKIAKQKTMDEYVVIYNEYLQLKEEKQKSATDIYYDLADKYLCGEMKIRKACLYAKKYINEINNK